MAAIQQRRTLTVLPENGKLRQAWEAGSLDWKRSIINLLVARVVCLPGQPGGRTEFGYRFDRRKVRIEWVA